MGIICIKHPKYEGRSAPNLACKTCCSLYIGEIRRSREEINVEIQNAQLPPPPPKFDSKSWLEVKKREAAQHYQSQLGSFHPESI